MTTQEEQRDAENCEKWSKMFKGFKDANPTMPDFKIAEILLRIREREKW